LWLLGARAARAVLLQAHTTLQPGELEAHLRLVLSFRQPVGAAVYKKDSLKAVATPALAELAPLEILILTAAAQYHRVLALHYDNRLDNRFFQRARLSPQPELAQRPAG
jgi:hypothetical protein